MTYPNTEQKSNTPMMKTHCQRSTPQTPNGYKEGTLLFYGRAIDSTILPTIGSIATQQSNSTRNTMQAITKLLNYSLYPKHDHEQQVSFTCWTNQLTQTKCQNQIATTNTQRTHQHQLPHHKRCLVIRCRGRTCQIVPQRKRCLPDEDSRGRNGTSATTHPNRN